MIGAAEVAFDAVLTEHGLTDWAARPLPGSATMT
jgi:hypothetical protein